MLQVCEKDCTNENIISTYEKSSIYPVSWLRVLNCEYELNNMIYNTKENGVNNVFLSEDVESYMYWKLFQLEYKQSLNSEDKADLYSLMKSINGYYSSNAFNGKLQTTIPDLIIEENDQKINLYQVEDW